MSQGQKERLNDIRQKFKRIGIDIVTRVGRNNNEYITFITDKGTITLHAQSYKIDGGWFEVIKLND